MKKYLLYACSLAFITGFTLQATAQTKKTAPKAASAKVQQMNNGKTMTWTSKSATAKELAQKALVHLLNIEFAQAYEGFSAALKLDPNFTVVLAIMSNLSYGETKKTYAEKAIRSAGDKTPGEKLFVTVVDEKSTEESRRETWAKLHEMFPDGKMIGSNYAFTRATADERFKAAEDYINKFPNEGSMYNLLGYYYMNEKKDNKKAKECFEKYITLYPEGSNPYDSMGEYYMKTGDNDNAIKYYSMSLEKYPFSHSSLAAMEKLTEGKEKKQE